MITASRAAALLRSTRDGAGEPLRVYWHEITEGSREAFASNLESAASTEGVPVVVLVLRKALFNNANSLLSDLLSLLEDNRSRFSSMSGHNSDRLNVVLLARSRLQIPQVSSPIVLPEWFPVLPGNEVHVRLLVLSDTVQDTLLNAEEARVEQMSELLHRLEELLVERIKEVYDTRPQSVDRILSALRDVGKGDLRERRDMLQAFRSHVRGVPNGRAYRPSLKEVDSLASRLILLVLRSSSDQLATLGEALAEALDLGGDVALRPSLLSVMMRPTRQIGRPARTGHTILTTIYYAYQFLTGAAHSGEYPSFPIGLIHSTSVDLRTALQDSAEMVRMLPSPTVPAQGR